MADESQYAIKIQPFTPAQIRKALESHSDEGVLDHIMADTVKADKLFKGIKSGKDKWLYFFVVFWNVSDANRSGLLNDSLSDALISNPHGVLMVITEMEKSRKLATFSESICGIHNERIMVEDQDFEKIVPRALKEINTRTSKVNEVTDPQLASVRKRCLDELERNKRFWENEQQKPIRLTPFTPKMIKKAIEAHGVENVSSYIGRYISVNNGKSDKLLKGIRNGKDEWLDLFILFRSVSDAMWSELLDGSIGYALANNPSRVLKIIADQSNLCSTLDEGWEEWGDGKKSDAEKADSAIKEINKRIKGVKQVKVPSLQNIKNKCLDELENSKRGWEEYKKGKGK